MFAPEIGIMFMRLMPRLVLLLRVLFERFVQLFAQGFLPFLVVVPVLFIIVIIIPLARYA